MNVFKHRRRVDGKIVVSRFYSGRYRLAGDAMPTTVALHTTDKQVAEAELRRKVRELELERAGLLEPKEIREGVQKLVVELVAEYLTERRRIGRNEKYVKGLQLQLSVIANGCGWKIVKDISAESFRAWRQKQKAVHPVTLNKYLSAISSLLTWLERAERIPRNPLKSVEKLLESDEPTYQRKALTLDQVRALLRSAGPRRALYATALKTCLRRGELEKLEWRDLRIDGDESFLSVRRSTTKNHKPVLMPIDDELAREFRTLRLANFSPSARVFAGGIPRMDKVRADFKAAGIEPTDAAGRHVDFHAFRMTFQMLLTLNGTAPRTVQELMRHSDPKLTMHTYTDVTQLPTAEAIRRQPSILPAPDLNTPENTPGLDAGGHDVPQVGTNTDAPIAPQIPQKEAIKHELASVVTNGHEFGGNARCRVRTCEPKRLGGGENRHVLPINVNRLPTKVLERGVRLAG